MRAEAVQLLQQHGIEPQDTGLITSVTNKTKRIAPPKLHALSTLQAAANKRWKYSPSHVLKLTQSLYEKSSFLTHVPIHSSLHIMSLPI